MNRAVIKPLCCLLAAGLVSSAHGAPPPGMTQAQGEVELIVMPRPVTCELAVGNDGAHGDNDGSALVWAVGLSEKAESHPGAGDNQASITRAAAALKRTFRVGFRNPAAGDGSMIENGCRLAAESLALSLRAAVREEAGGVWPGKILSTDGRTWFSYGVAVNEAQFRQVAETAAGGQEKITVDFPSSNLGTMNGATVLRVDGTVGDQVIIRRAPESAAPSFTLGEYPFEVYLRRDYRGPTAPSVHRLTGTSGDDSGVNQYRSHFVVTATYG